MRFNRPWSILLALSALIVFTACPPEEAEVPEPEEPGFTLVVWHAWDEEAVPVLESAVQSYEEESGGQVELVAFDDETRLREQLTTTDSPPDVFFGSHYEAGNLFEEGLVNAYCLPDGCEQCRGENPPDWCRYALAQFGETLIDRFQIGTGYCTQDTCPACFSEIPPLWCKYALGEIAAGIDLPRASFTTVIDGEPFPLGIPIWWEFTAIVANRTWFEEQGVDLPQDVASLRAVLDEHADAVRVEDRTLDGHPVPFPADLGRFQGDPSPQPSVAALMIGSSRHLSGLGETVPEAQVLRIDGFQPPVLFHGTFLREGTELRSEGLEFMYDLTYPDFQRRLFDAVGGLPADSRALEGVEENLPEGTVEAGTAGLPVGAGRLDESPDHPPEVETNGPPG